MFKLMIRSVIEGENNQNISKPIIINYYNTRKKAEEVKRFLEMNDKKLNLYNPETYVIREVPDEEYNNISYKSGFSKNYYKSVR